LYTLDRNLFVDSQSMKLPAVFSSNESYQ